MNPPIKKKSSTKKAAKEAVPEKKAVNVKKTTTRKVAKNPANTSMPDISSINISPEERWKMIAITAYHKAENRGFEPGGELQDWVEAEQEVDKLVSS
jgi:Protein of unknown function (DUF2934)